MGRAALFSGLGVIIDALPYMTEEARKAFVASDTVQGHLRSAVWICDSLERHGESFAQKALLQQLDRSRDEIPGLQGIKAEEDIGRLTELAGDLKTGLIRRA